MSDRLSPLDASFLHLEDESAHMHVASVMLFEGDPPSHEEMVEAIESRLHLVPRYRQKLAFVPFGQTRPKWVDDPHFNVHYHLRSTALPPPGTEEQLRATASRVFSQRLDRDKPLWEIWVAEGLEGDRWALFAKTHHALVDGISGVDITTVLFDTEREPATPPGGGRAWQPKPLPTGVDLLAEAMVERATVPAEIGRTMRALFRGPRQVARGVRDALVGVGAMTWAGMRPAPPSIYNTEIGPHRRLTWVRVSLQDLKAIKNSLGGTVNDVVLAVVAGGLKRHLHSRGVKTDGLELRAMVPVSVRSADQRGALGNQVAAIWAPLPVGLNEPLERLEAVREAMAQLKQGGQAVGATTLTRMSGFAPPTVMAQASRLMSRQRFFNLVVTNVPGPQFPLYLLGREMVDTFPLIPLAQNQALGVAIMSYNGKMNFGLVGDYDSMPDIEDLAEYFQQALADLARIAGVQLTPERSRRKLPSRNGRARQGAKTTS